jgi:hypothetical protein
MWSTYSGFINNSLDLIAQSSRSVSIKVVHYQKRDILQVDQIHVEQLTQTMVVADDYVVLCIQKLYFFS